MNYQNLLSFLADLAQNNNKDWFDANRKTYEVLKKEWQVKVATFIKQIAEFDKTVSHLEPKDCIFRINRDIRFAKDKSPYKTNFGAYICMAGKKASVANRAGYYLHIEPNKSFIAGGLYMPDAPDLKKVRQEIDYNFKEFNSILSNKDFKKHFKTLEGEKLKTTPKGYDEKNEAIEFLKHKSFIVSKAVTDAEITGKDFEKMLIESFRVMKPFHDFLNKALEE
jgi:uncharacterized protein (TIGR02453 family)